MAGGGQGGTGLMDWLASMDAGATAANNTGFWGNQQANTKGGWDYGIAEGNANAAYQQLLQNLAAQKEMQQAALGQQHYATDQQLAGLKYGADQNLSGIKYGADQGLAGQKYGADQNLAGIKYGADQNLIGSKYHDDSSVRMADIGIQPQMGKLELAKTGILPLVGNLTSSMFGIGNPLPQNISTGDYKSQAASTPVVAAQPTPSSAPPPSPAPAAAPVGGAFPAFQQPAVGPHTFAAGGPPRSLNTPPEHMINPPQQARIPPWMAAPRGVAPKSPAGASGGPVKFL